MSLFIESIRIQNKRAWLLDLHQQRMDAVFSYFGKNNPHLLKNYLPKGEYTQEGIYKWRVCYDLSGFIHSQVQAYTLNTPGGFSLVKADQLNYSFKYENREALNKLEKSAGGNTAIFYQNRKITDSSYSNLIFEKDMEWYTPETFLLNGVMRQYLLNTHRIKSRDISLDNLHEFSSFQMINAMIPFGTQKYCIDFIQNLFRD
ncbi:aminodeoxychorismate lyase [Elizabethkingia argentiflava]|uniref:Aminodeoxychorismate lyase n=1 Tax=Elizabethkingia argenteiflava TaxID=2681556 RepID=A0A845PTI1_9FLAO|nr:aminotransferase class IV [Elizabethkingia argenteiflava]NAW51542.1 aminodeoxychorismate lyase [Elizabethkingia argenteiflava]